MAIDWGLVLGAVGVVGLPMAIGAGLAVAANTKGEFHFVRGCFIIAALLTLGSLAWLTYEQPLGYTKITISALVGAVAAVALVVSLNWVRQREIAALESEFKPEPKIASVETPDLQALANFIGGKDEHHLRMLFDFMNLMNRNILIYKHKIGYIRNKKENDFSFGPYLEPPGGNMLAEMTIGRWFTGPNGVRFEAATHDVVVIVLTTQYQIARAALTRFENSTELPESIIGPLREFTKVVEHDAKLLILVLNEKMHDSEDQFLFADDPSSRYSGTIQHSYFAQFVDLQESAKKVTDAIRAHRAKAN